MITCQNNSDHTGQGRANKDLFKLFCFFIDQQQQQQAKHKNDDEWNACKLKVDSNNNDGR